HVLHRVDLGERDAVVGALGLHGEDAAVGLDGRDPLAGGEEDARETALERNRGALAALLDRRVRGVDERVLRRAAGSPREPGACAAGAYDGSYSAARRYCDPAARTPSPPCASRMRPR